MLDGKRLWQVWPYPLLTYCPRNADTVRQRCHQENLWKSQMHVWKHSWSNCMRAGSFGNPSWGVFLQPPYIHKHLSSSTCPAASILSISFNELSRLMKSAAFGLGQLAFRSKRSKQHAQGKQCHRPSQSWKKAPASWDQQAQASKEF